MKTTSLKIGLALSLLILASGAASAAILPGEHRLDATDAAAERLPSNSIIDIVLQGELLWFGTNRGLTALDPVTEDWQVFRQEDGIGRGGVSALIVNDSIIWIATAYSVNTDFGYKPAGGGVGFSTDDGVNWTWMKQPVDAQKTDTDPQYYQPTTTNIQNVTYDIALSDSSVWIVSFGGGLRRLRYDDINAGNLTWQVITPDTVSFSALLNKNHRGFSATYAAPSLWVGTAEGINRSDDEGYNWTSFRSVIGSRSGITGEFITALAAQRLVADTLIWAATWEAEKAGEYYGVCVTEDGLNWRVALSDSSYSLDGGQTWRALTPGDSVAADMTFLVDVNGPLRVHNFGFQDSVVWAAADKGLWRSRDLGYSWVMWAGEEGIYDPTLNERLVDADYFSVAGVDDRTWVGTDDGLAVNWDASGSGDFTWRIHRAHRTAGVGGEPKTYAYPNPFSPTRGHVTRIQFQVTGPNFAKYSIWNFAMEKVFESAGSTMPGGVSGDMAGYGALIWDGRDNSDRIVANGVYFYKVEVGGEAHWGKVMVLD